MLYSRWSIVLTVFSPRQADSFAVTGSHVSPSSHLDYVESHYLTLESDLPEDLKKKSRLLFGRDIHTFTDFVFVNNFGGRKLISSMTS